MQSVLIVGLKEKTKEKLLQIAKEYGVSKFDMEFLETEKALGISDVKNMQKKIFLTPLKGDKKIVAIETFFGATTEAQNALLKVLEEPPPSTIMAILCKTTDFVLPTILSRCSIINISENTKQEKEDFEKNLKILKEIKNDNIGNGFLYAQNYGKTKEEALAFLEDLIISLEAVLDKDDEALDSKDKQKMLKKLLKFHTLIKSTNVNVRFALENLFLNF